MPRGSSAVMRRPGRRVHWGQQGTVRHALPGPSSEACRRHAPEACRRPAFLHSGSPSPYLDVANMILPCCGHDLTFRPRLDCENFQPGPKIFAHACLGTKRWPKNLGLLLFIHGTYRQPAHPSAIFPLPPPYPFDRVRSRTKRHPKS
ncbi:hypothetical protein PVAP13_1NG374000 [Panicum virgatum]|uniref:Uncharacterized protein n=1 Tax=Panicum virgatum TaxID=38727 RepID=A0A8T0X5T9_PANVG|nr:hypothetical protein PVAP13_1NG374000 [Panicum virgatum]